MKDYADRTWCKDPMSQAWRDAQLKEFRALNPNLKPKVAISSLSDCLKVLSKRVYSET